MVLDCYNCTRFELYKEELRIERVKKIKQKRKHKIVKLRMEEA